MPGRLFIPSAALCLAAIVVCLCLMPGVGLIRFVTASVAISLITSCTFLRCPFRSRGGAIVLLLAFTLTACGVIANVHWFTAGLGGDCAHPVLLNSDAALDWGAASGQSVERVRNYSRLIGALLALFGTDITVPLLFNQLCYMLTLLLTGAIAWALTADRRVATVAMAAALLVFYLGVQATVLIKDVPLTMLMGIVALLCVRLYKSAAKCQLPLWLALALTTLAMMFLRDNIMFFLALGFGMMALRFRPLRIDWHFGVAVVLCLAARGILPLLQPDATTVASSLSLDTARYIQFPGSNADAWDRILGDYSAISLAGRLLWLPVALAVQFVIPLPWNCMSYIDFGLTEPLAHCGFFWYIAGALVLYWLFADMRHAGGGFRRLTLWGVAMTVLTAYATGGHVSRYCLVYLPTLLPAAAWVAVRDYRRRNLWLWLGIFTLALAVVLAVAWHIQKGGGS